MNVKIGLRLHPWRTPILDLNEFVNPLLNFTHDKVFSHKLFSVPRIFVLNPQFISL